LIETYNKRHNKNLSIKDIDCELEKLPPDVYREVISIFNESGWFLNLEPLPDAIQLVSRFVDLEYEITICTAPARDLNGMINGKSAEEKYTWLKQKLPFWANNAIITKYKEIIGVDLLIDDTGYNIINWCRRHQDGVGYLVDQPWNQNFTDLPTNAVRSSLKNVSNFIEKFWCKDRGIFVFRFNELLDWMQLNK
jgi:5'(3')-deoxyribonucleotidase